MLVKSYIPSSALPLAGVEHCCLMYTHAPSTFPSIIPLSKPLSHAHFPQAPCCPPLFIEYIFYSATFFHLSWQLQLLCGVAEGQGGGQRTRGPQRGKAPSHFHRTHHAPASEGHLGWNEQTLKMTQTSPFSLLFLLFLLFKDKRSLPSPPLYFMKK